MVVGNIVPSDCFEKVNFLSLGAFSNYQSFLDLFVIQFLLEVEQELSLNLIFALAFFLFINIFKLMELISFCFLILLFLSSLVFDEILVVLLTLFSFFLGETVPNVSASNIFGILRNILAVRISVDDVLLHPVHQVNLFIYVEFCVSDDAGKHLLGDRVHEIRRRVHDMLETVGDDLHGHLAELGNFKLNRLVQEVRNCVQMQQFVDDVVVKIHQKFFTFQRVSLRVNLVHIFVGNFIGDAVEVLKRVSLQILIT